MTGNDIVEQKFARSFRGYDIQEVDLFLDEVVRELDRRDRERNENLATIEKLLKKLDELQPNQGHTTES